MTTLDFTWSYWDTAICPLSRSLIRDFFFFSFFFTISIPIRVRYFRGLYNEIIRYFCTFRGQVVRRSYFRAHFQHIFLSIAHFSIMLTASLRNVFTTRAFPKEVETEFEVKNAFLPMGHASVPFFCHHLAELGPP